MPRTRNSTAITVIVTTLTICLFESSIQAFLFPQSLKNSPEPPGPPGDDAPPTRGEGCWSQSVDRGGRGVVCTDPASQPVEPDVGQEDSRAPSSDSRGDDDEGERIGTCAIEPWIRSKHDPFSGMSRMAGLRRGEWGHPANGRHRTFRCPVIVGSWIPPLSQPSFDPNHPCHAPPRLSPHRATV